MFWRNFAALQPIGALGFLTRHGDPLGALDRGEITDVSAWMDLANALGAIANCWHPHDARWISTMNRDPTFVAAADDALKALAPAYLQPGGMQDLVTIWHEGAMVQRAGTLEAFMIASAASAFQRRVTMRICDECRDWFELKRADARFCSGSCQAAESKRRLAAQR